MPNEPDSNPFDLAGRIRGGSANCPRASKFKRRNRNRKKRQRPERVGRDQGESKPVDESTKNDEGQR